MAQTLVAIDLIKDRQVALSIDATAQILSNAGFATTGIVTAGVFNGTVGATTPSTGAFTTVTATGNVSLTGTGLLLETASNAVSAAGTTQATGTVLTTQINTVSTVGAGSGVNLPASVAGLMVSVTNTGANALLVYPAQGATDTINGVAATIGVAIPVNSTGLFTAAAAGAWTVQLTTVKQTAFNSVASATPTLALTAANITGGLASVDLAIAGVVGGAIAATLPTVASMVLAMAAPAIGSSFRLRICNTNSTQVVTVGTNTGWTLTGTMTIASATWREFIVTLTSLSAATIQNVAVGTFS